MCCYPRHAFCIQHAQPICICHRALSLEKKIDQNKYSGQNWYSVTILCDCSYRWYSRINIPLFQNSISILWVQVLLRSKIIFYSGIESTEEATLAQLLGQNFPCSLALNSEFTPSVNIWILRPYSFAISAVMNQGWGVDSLINCVPLIQTMTFWKDIASATTIAASNLK